MTAGIATGGKTSWLRGAAIQIVILVVTLAAAEVMLRVGEALAQLPLRC